MLSDCSDTRVKSIRRKARVPYSATQMFDLVNDVRAYPEFLPWCQAATVQLSRDDRLEATLDVGVGVVHKQFSTRNRLNRPRSIEIELLQGPFRKLTGAWRFDDLSEDGCEVALALDFDVSSMPLKFLFEPFFEELARSQMDAFIKRAEIVYG